ncbi:telomere length regulation protein-domain-containing protein [Hygrophoropsis aurantiaca]|uniref:Telomere length regulation protein-domain-containing protein n=1 Tax=Hygrophoropsis aurantiaca TaxID=72124 RepID=A0ACB8ARW2_9AGAM|nr:telomere length regulation protein-domain-containing protein [Hygrophoropsis aurantiaca]
MDNTLAQVKDTVDRLQAPIADLPTLLTLLCRPLDCIGLLPPQYRRYNVDPISRKGFNIKKIIPSLQRSLLEIVLPTWEPSLDEEGLSLLVLQYFCPDAFTYASSAAGVIALLAYSTVLSLPLRAYTIQLLTRLSKGYPIDRLYTAVVSQKQQPALNSVAWDDCLRNVFAVPSKVANALDGKNIPSELESGTYFDGISLRCEHLLDSLSTGPIQDNAPPLSRLFIKLVNNGIFPASATFPSTQSSFFKVTLPVIRERLNDDQSYRYSALWIAVLGSLSSSLAQQTILGSLFSSLTLSPSLAMDVSASGRGLIAREANLLCGILGSLTPESDIWESALAVITTRNWTEAHARLFVCWVFKNSTDNEVNDFLVRIMNVWGASDHVKYSVLSKHHYITSLLLLIISYFPPESKQVITLALSPSFISAISLYISHLDGSVRRCGMLAAEMVAQRAGKQLDFGDWEGDEDSRPWAREIRELCSARDVDAAPRVDQEETGPEPDELIDEIVTAGVLHDQSLPTPKPSKVSVNPPAGYDSDDSLTGYASPPSSRSASPTPSELDEIEKDPTLRVGVKKIARPVYLAQLGEMIRNTAGLKSEDVNQEVDKIEMALSVGEDLIRRKRDYGTELAENAANLVYGFIGLQDNFEIGGFDEKRQHIVTALVASCPRVVASALVEEFFKNQYSTEQRFVMLNALALGARELASLPVTSANQKPLPSTTFPSKKLPPALHQKYLAAGSQDNVRLLLEDITHAAIDRGREESTNEPPTIVRERQLRIRKPAKVTPVRADTDRTHLSNSNRDQQVIYTDIAVEFFIAPFMNRFWLFLRDEMTREERSAHRDTLHQYRGAGTGLILNPIVLSHFLSTMAILVHAAHNAPQWLAIVAPDALELAVTLGTRTISTFTDDGTDEIADGVQSSSKAKEASVLTSALELALVVLDGSLELDRGRSLGLEHTALLLGTGEWAGQVFSQIEKGVLVEGGGGVHELKLQKTAAGVLLKVDELTSKWRRSMVDIR